MIKDPQKLVQTFRHRVTIQNVVQVSDGQGGFTETYPDGNTVWCSIEPLSSYEKFQAMQMAAPTTHKIKMRYTSEINSDSRLLFDGRVFWVKEVVDEEERQRFLTIKAIEQGN